MSCFLLLQFLENQLSRLLCCQWIFISWVIYFPELCGGAKLGFFVLLPTLQTPGFSSWPQASQHGSWVAHIKYFHSPEVLSLTCSRSHWEQGLLALDPVFPCEYRASRLVPAVPTRTVQTTDFFGLPHKAECWQCSVGNGSISVQA